MSDTQDPKQDSGIRKRVKNWLRDSISGINIVQGIHRNIRRVLGLSEDDMATAVGKALVDTIDRIVRKGRSPADLFQETEVWRAFEALCRHFPDESVVLKVRDNHDQVFEQRLNLFRSLHQHALAARSDEHRMQEYDRIINEGANYFQKKKLTKQISDAKSRNAERALLFQKLIFSEADRIERTDRERHIRQGDRVISLLELTADLTSVSKRFDKLMDQGPPLPEAPPFEQESESPAAETATQPSEDARPARKPASEPEVIDWGDIKPNKEDTSLDDSFHLDF